MSNQTIKKDPNNRGHSELEARLRSIWLGKQFLNITISQDIQCDVKEIRRLLDEAS